MIRSGGAGAVCREPATAGLSDGRASARAVPDASRSGLFPSNRSMVRITCTPTLASGFLAGHTGQFPVALFPVVLDLGQGFLVGFPAPAGVRRAGQAKALDRHAAVEDRTVDLRPALCPAPMGEGGAHRVYTGKTVTLAGRIPCAAGPLSWPEDVGRARN